MEGESECFLTAELAKTCTKLEPDRSIVMDDCVDDVEDRMAHVSVLLNDKDTEILRDATFTYDELVEDEVQYFMRTNLESTSLSSNSLPTVSKGAPFSGFKSSKRINVLMPDFPDSSSGSPRAQFVFTNVEFSGPINENGATKECSPDFENCPRKCTSCKKTKSHDYYEGKKKSCVSCLAKKKVTRDLVRKASTGEKLPSTPAEQQEIALTMAREQKDSDDDDHPSKKKRISTDSDTSRPDLDEGRSTISSSASGAGTSSGVDSSTTPECPPCLTAESNMVVHYRKGSSKRDVGTSFSELLGMSEVIRVIPLVGFIILGLIGIVTCLRSSAQYIFTPKYPEFRNLLGEDQGNTNPQTHLICTLCLLGVCPIFVFIALKRFTFKKERHDVDQDLELNQRSMTR